MLTYEFNQLNLLKKKAVSVDFGIPHIPQDVSPMRYPGGKAKLSRFMALFIVSNKLDGCTLVEPFCGGAGGTLPLLISGLISKLVLNDLNPCIASFWRTIVKDPSSLISMIESEPVTIDAWHNWRNIYFSPEGCTDLEKGFSAFFLNRTNRSGMLHAGPIGGRNQSHDTYTIDCRFNKENLIKRIELIAKHSKKIKVTEVDACKSLNKRTESDFIYADPPYVQEGRNIYNKFCFSENDHTRFAKKMMRSKSHWLLSYDDHPLIHQLYSSSGMNIIELSYAINKARIGRELLIASANSRQPNLQLSEDTAVPSYNKVSG
ncbi:DNA adenine methylase [uncultured Pluralibacter sp.]|uniref:DNA adenine methylase n=1 Tax=uncultured Pluralibacter sp. TaxID=1490864 RepID=UPI002621CB99|nr:DNA adenine methylase [uncultured Pluralibacter sp.]